MISNLELFIKITPLIGALISLLTIVVLVWQIRTMRRELKAQNHIEMTARWNEISKLEISEPMFHKLLLGPRAMKATENADDKLIRKRAFAHMVFDVFSQKFRASEEIEGKLPSYDYLNLVMSNPEFRELWSKYEIREAWDGDPLQNLFDQIIENYDQ